MTEDDQRSGANSHKESDLAALRKVWANRQSKPQDNPKQPKVKAEQAEQADEADQRRQTMPPGGYGKTISDPFVIDDD